MSLASELKRAPDENKLVMALVRRKVLTDGQVKAAMDYQRSLGGKLADIIVKLGLARAAQVEEVLKNPDGTESSGSSERSEHVLDPSTVKPSDLKVHKKLLEKIPADLQEKHLLVPFFPLPSGDSRRIIMGHGRPTPVETISKVRAILGVELCTLALEERVARELTSPDPRGESGKRSAAQAPRGEPRADSVKTEPVKAAPASAEIVTTDQIVGALMALLLRKGTITREELEAEILSSAAPHLSDQ